MRSEALFLNGVFDGVIQEILKVQRELPEQIMFLQPYSSARIAHVAEDPPSVDDSVRLFISTTDDPPTVKYAAAVVGWDSKPDLHEDRAQVIRRLLWTLQPNEGGLYNLAQGGSAESVNLLHVWRMRELRRPFSVSELTLTSTGEPHSPGRTTAGGWSYVQNPGDRWLEQYL